MLNSEEQVSLMSSVVNENVSNSKEDSKRVCRCVLCSTDCWRTGVPPTWLVFSALLLVQVRREKLASV